MEVRVLSPALIWTPKSKHGIQVSALLLHKKEPCSGSVSGLVAGITQYPGFSKSSICNSILIASKSLGGGFKAFSAKDFNVGISLITDSNCA